MDVKQKLFEIIRAGGKPITDEHFEARKAICHSCPHFSQCLPVTEVPGCGICKCPLETKGKLWTYFSITKLKTVRAECPLSKWAEVDHNFNLKNDYDGSRNS